MDRLVQKMSVVMSLWHSLLPYAAEVFESMWSGNGLPKHVDFVFGLPLLFSTLQATAYLKPFTTPLQSEFQKLILGCSDIVVNLSYPSLVMVMIILMGLSWGTPVKECEVPFVFQITPGTLKGKKKL